MAGAHTLDGDACQAALTFGSIGFLELGQGGEVFFALTAEAGFLDRKIGELAAKSEIGMGFDEGRANGRILLFEEIGELDPADGVDVGFKSRDAEQSPLGVRDGLHEDLLRFGGGFVLGDFASDVLLVRGGVIGRQQHGAAGETRFDGVERAFGFGLRRFRAGGELSVLAVRLDLSGG